MPRLPRICSRLCSCCCFFRSRLSASVDEDTGHRRSSWDADSFYTAFSESDDSAAEETVVVSNDSPRKSGLPCKPRQSTMTDDSKNIKSCGTTTARCTHEDDALNHILGLTPENKRVYQETLAMFSNMEEMRTWKCCFQENSGNMKSRAVYKMGRDNRSFSMQISIDANYSASEIWCSRLETETWPLWNSNVARSHVTGTTNHKWQDQAHFENTPLFYLYKSDVNVVNYRWINEKEKFFVLRNANLEPGQDGYVAPKNNRDNLSFAAITTCPEPKKTHNLIRIDMVLPIVVPDWAQKWLFKTLTPKIVRLVETTAKQTSNPKYPFKARIEEDAKGIYAELNKLQHFPADQGVYWDPTLLN